MLKYLHDQLLEHKSWTNGGNFPRQFLLFSGIHHPGRLAIISSTAIRAFTVARSYGKLLHPDCLKAHPSSPVPCPLTWPSGPPPHPAVPPLQHGQLEPVQQHSSSHPPGDHLVLEPVQLPHQQLPLPPIHPLASYQASWHTGLTSSQPSRV